MLNRTYDTNLLPVSERKLLNSFIGIQIKAFAQLSCLAVTVNVPKLRRIADHLFNLHALVEVDLRRKIACPLMDLINSLCDVYIQYFRTAACRLDISEYGSDRCRFTGPVRSDKAIKIARIHRHTKLGYPPAAAIVFS